VSKNPEAQRERWNRAAAAVLSAARRDHEPPISQEELAHHLEVTRNVIANIESARKEIGIAELILIAHDLKLDPVALLKLILGWPSSRQR
jgi:ribosome-binding protein aMBF1 (putative translation factor)